MVEGVTILWESIILKFDDKPSPNCVRPATNPTASKSRVRHRLAKTFRTAEDPAGKLNGKA